MKNMHIDFFLFINTNMNKKLMFYILLYSKTIISSFVKGFRKTFLLSSYNPINNVSYISFHQQKKKQQCF